jgi:hypothetical protein
VCTEERVDYLNNLLQNILETDYSFCSLIIYGATLGLMENDIRETIIQLYLNYLKEETCKELPF